MIPFLHFPRLSNCMKMCVPPFFKDSKTFKLHEDVFPPFFKDSNLKKVNIFGVSLLFAVVNISYVNTGI